jgi:hypothetical protein
VPINVTLNEDVATVVVCMTTSHANTSFPGENNRGAQIGSVVGNVSLSFVDHGGALVMANGVVDPNTNEMSSYGGKPRIEAQSVLHGAFLS